MLLSLVEQSGSDITKYVQRLHQILEDKSMFINALKSKLIDFSSHLQEVKKSN